MTEKGKTTGAGALMLEPPVLDIEGKKYPLRKLGLVDIERILVIVKKVSKSVDALKMTSLDELTAQKGVQFFIDFMPYAMDEIVDFMGSVIGLKTGIPFDVAEDKRKKSKADHPQDPNEGTMRDPNVFPLGSEVKLLLMLSEHPDVVNLLTVGQALKEIPLVKTFIDKKTAKKEAALLRKQSTESKLDTGGQTNTPPDED